MEAYRLIVGGPIPHPRALVGLQNFAIYDRSPLRTPGVRHIGVGAAPHGRPPKGDVSTDETSWSCSSQVGLTGLHGRKAVSGRLLSSDGVRIGSEEPPRSLIRDRSSRRPLGGRRTDEVTVWPAEASRCCRKYPHLRRLSVHPINLSNVLDAPLNGSSPHPAVQSGASFYLGVFIQSPCAYSKL